MIQAIILLGGKGTRISRLFPDRPKALALIEPGKAISLETDIFPQLTAQGQLRAFPVPPPLLDMGTPEGLAAMDHYFLAET